MSKQNIGASALVSKRLVSSTLVRSQPVFLLVVIIFITLRFWKITTFSLWGGEAFTMIGVEKAWMDMFSYIIADIVHPPLFYVLLKFWIALGGESLFWLKLLPVLSGIALVVPFYFLCRELNFQWPEMALALFLAAVNGYLIHYAQELRMYSLFTFLSLCSFWLFMRYFNSNAGTTGKLVALTFVNLLNIYTHYYGWIVVGIEFLFLIIWQRQKLLYFGLSALILLILFAPWASLVIREAQSIGGLERNLNWIPKPDVVEVLNFYSTLNGPFGSRWIKFLGLLLFGLPIILWFLRIIRSGFKGQPGETISFSWLVLLSFLPVFFIYLVSQRTKQAIWIDRYFIFIALPYFLLVAVAVNRLEPKWLRYLWVGLFISWSMYAGLRDLSSNRMAWAGAQMGSRVKWESMSQQIIQAEEGNSEPINVYTLTVISKGLRTGDWAVSTSMDYFLDSYREERFNFVYARDIQALLKNPSLEEHFWVAFFELAESPQPSPKRKLEEAGYRVGEAIVFQQLSNRVVLLPVWRK